MEAAEIPAEVGVEVMGTGMGETAAIGAFGAVDGGAAIAFTGVRSLPLVSAFRFTAFIPGTAITHMAGIIRTAAGTIPTAGIMVRATIRTINKANIIMVLSTQDALLAPRMPGL
jgi:hypothetical protein